MILKSQQMGKQFMKMDISSYDRTKSMRKAMKNYDKYPLYLYNSLSRKKEKFIPIHEPHVGLYVCGPTVYNDVHIGNCRTFVSFDVMYRYLMHLGYKVRYVRNITDVGHLMDTGEDKL